jgi:hypothetical protein
MNTSLILLLLIVVILGAQVKIRINQDQSAVGEGPVRSRAGFPLVINRIELYFRAYRSVETIHRCTETEMIGTISANHIEHQRERIEHRERPVHRFRVALDRQRASVSGATESAVKARAASAKSAGLGIAGHAATEVNAQLFSAERLPLPIRRAVLRSAESGLEGLRTHRDRYGRLNTSFQLTRRPERNSPGRIDRGRTSGAPSLAT